MGLESGDSTLREDVREIKKAAERASGLTRQILAFSRRQALQPQVISMNDLVAEMEPLLQRTLGEDIDLVITLDPELGATEVDPNQLMLDQGYNILAAGTAAEALAIFESNEGPIDLLLTDVVLPGGMQGNDLAQVAVSLQADLPVLYISGCTRDAILESGRLIEGLEYLEKPFTPGQLASKVRDVLDAHPGAT